VFNVKLLIVEEGLTRLLKIKPDPKIIVFIYNHNQSVIKTLYNTMENLEAARLIIEKLKLSMSE
jgi:hypothetical protein